MCKKTAASHSVTEQRSFLLFILNMLLYDDHGTAGSVGSKVPEPRIGVIGLRPNGPLNASLLTYLPLL